MERGGGEERREERLRTESWNDQKRLKARYSLLKMVASVIESH